MAARKRSYEKYLDIESAGSKDFEPEVTGYLIDLESPEEQGLKDFTTLDLADDQKVEVPTGWKATFVDEDGVEHLWRWPAYKSKDGENCLGTNIMPQDMKLRDILGKDVLVHCYRSSNRRAHIDLVEDEDE